MLDYGRLAFDALAPIDWPFSLDLGLSVNGTTVNRSQPSAIDRLPAVDHGQSNGRSIGA